MQKRNAEYEIQKIAVDLPELMRMLSLGRASAAKVATEAGAQIKIGRRSLFLVEKISDYLNNQAAKNEQEDC